MSSPHRQCHKCMSSSLKYSGRADAGRLHGTRCCPLVHSGYAGWSRIPDIKGPTGAIDRYIIKSKSREHVTLVAGDYQVSVLIFVSMHTLFSSFLLVFLKSLSTLFVLGL